MNAVKFAFSITEMNLMAAKPEYVVLVNSKDRKTGIAGKLEAHEQGWLHRAFSIFIFNNQGEMLLQQRAAEKYHFGGLWTNACCSHPRPGEKVLQAAGRRLHEELGIIAHLKKFGAITYSFYDAESKLTEHEYDHIITGTYSGTFHLNPAEVQKVRWISLKALAIELKQQPLHFTPWFSAIMKEYPQLLNTSTLRNTRK